MGSLSGIAFFVQAAEARSFSSAGRSLGVSSSPVGRLRISLPLIGMLVMPSLTAFMHSYPAVELDVDFSDSIVDVIEEGFDVVICTGAPSRGNR